jgi:hypothetical protein
MDYLVVAEDKNGIWFDGPEVAESLKIARLLAEDLYLPKDHAAVIYRLSFQEVARESANASATADSPKGVNSNEGPEWNGNGN